MILLLAAMNIEAEPLINKLDGKKVIENLEFDCYSGYVNNIEVMVAITGIGKVNASFVTTRMLSLYKFDYIINFGFVGGVLPLKKKEIVYVKKARYHDFDLTVMGYLEGQVPKREQYFYTNDNSIINKKSITLLTGDKFLLTNIMGDEVYVVDMEGTSIYQVAGSMNMSVISIKIVSDIINDDDQEETYQSSEKDDTSDVLCNEVIDYITEMNI